MENLRYKLCLSFITLMMISFTFTNSVYGLDQSITNYIIELDVISAGGGDVSSVNYDLFYTIGQSSAIGISSSRNYINYAGFLFPFSPDSTEVVSTPSTPSGSTSGNTGVSYSYSTGGSTSSLGHSVEYQFDWKGDSSDLSSWGSATQSKTWTTDGAYNVRARARCSQDISIVSSWSGTLTVTITGTNSVFSDVPIGYWAYNYIMAIYNAHITTGCSQNPLKYCPEDNVTREQMAAFIVRAKEGEPATNYCSTGSSFPDVDANSWACKYIKRLKELGVTTGYGDGRYGPLDTVTREQMAAFIVRAKEGEPAANYCSTGSLFPDVDANSWACKYIKRLKELGITTGYGDGRYGPLDMVTRAQMAAFLARAFLGMQ